LAAGADGAANVVEVFSSIQGEGPWVGASTLFVRLGQCDLRCRWCDSPGTWLPADEARIERGRGSGKFEAMANPLSVPAVVAACEALDLEAHRFVAITGGEPLLQAAAVRALALALGGRGPRIFLETHGLAEAGLREVIDRVDVVSMDWKLASDVRRESDPRHGSAIAPFHEAHERFLRVAHAGADVTVKLVVTPASEDAEIDEAATRIAGVDPGIPVILQPVTPVGAVRERPSAERMLALEARLARRLGDVRVIPQTHPIWGAR